MANTKIQKLVNSKEVKVVFNTSSKDFTATMSKFYLALSEMNDKKLVYGRNLRSAQDWLKTLEDNNVDGKNDAKINAQNVEIVDLKDKYDATVDEINERIKECYTLIPSDLYANYTSGNYAKGVTEFFNAHNIKPTDTLVKFMVETVGLRCASAKVMFKNGVTLDYQSKNTLNKLFMSTLAQLMLDKNALKLDMYKWTYTEEDKKSKKTK